MRPALRWRPAVTVTLAAALVAGCEGAYDLPLPGGAAAGDDVYRVTVELADVMDLVPQSAVRVNDVTVGAVESISLDGWTAVVVVRLEDSVHLPDNVVAELRQTSLLGEKFVSLAAPPDAEAVGRLSDGDVIGLARTGRAPEVEEVLGALSLLLNGGGIAQLQVITRELNDALEGRESDVRGLLRELDVFVGGLEDQKSEIVRALDAIDRLAARLADQRDEVATTLEQLPAGLRTLEEQRAQLVEMLTALSDLGVVATDVVNRSQADTVANLKALQPILTRLNEAGQALPDSLQLLFTYPFHDGVTRAVHGDYTNLDITLDADLASLRRLLPAAPAPTAPGPRPGPGDDPAPGSPLPLPELPPVPGLPRLPGLPGPSGQSADPDHPDDRGLAGLLLPGVLR